MALLQPRDIERLTGAVNAHCGRAPFFALAARVQLVVFHTMTWTQYHLHDEPEARLRADALANRLAYLTPFFYQSPLGLRGTDAMEAAEAYLELDPSWRGTQLILAYAHFRELMPEIYRGRYVGVLQEDVLTLALPTPVSEATEIRDVLLSDLAAPYRLAPDVVPAETFDDMAITAPVIDLHLIEDIQRRLYDAYEYIIFEPALLTDQGFTAALGTTRSEFSSVRAAMYALADFCLGMASALRRRLEEMSVEDARKDRELLEWISVNWQTSYLLGRLQELSGLPAKTIHSVLAPFVIDFSGLESDAPHAGEGYFPPLASFGNSLVFSPDMVQLFFLERNILYGLNRTDPTKFSVVSAYLEPALLASASRAIQRLPNVVIAQNVRWQGAGRRGELDLVAYSTATNTALHIQAKSAIPPQGWRMVERLTARSMEGLNQLKAFRQLAIADKDRILSSALGRTVHNATVYDLLLSRSCFGSERVWAAADSDRVTLANAALLWNATNDAGMPDISELPAAIEGTLTTLVAESQPNWVEEEIDLEVLRVRFPILRYDETALQRLRWRMRTLHAST